MWILQPRNGHEYVQVPISLLLNGFPCLKKYFNSIIAVKNRYTNQSPRPR